MIYGCLSGTGTSVEIGTLVPVVEANKEKSKLKKLQLSAQEMQTQSPSKNWLHSSSQESSRYLIAIIEPCSEM